MGSVTEDPGQAGVELSAADEQVLRELTGRARAGGLKLTGELQAAASDTPVDRGRVRRALSGVLKVLGRAGASAAKNVAVTMGDDLVREIGQDIIHQLPH